MYTKLPIVLIGEDSSALTALRQQLAQEPAVLLDDHICGFTDAVAALRAKKGPVLAVVDLSRDAERALRMAEEIKLQVPDSHLLVTAQTKHLETVLQAMRSGAEEFLLQPIAQPELFQALERIREKVHRQWPRLTQQGRLSWCWRAKAAQGQQP